MYSTYVVHCLRMVATFIDIRLRVTWAHCLSFELWGSKSRCPSYAITCTWGFECLEDSDLEAMTAINFVFVFFRNNKSEIKFHFFLSGRLRCDSWFSELKLTLLVAIDL